MTLKLSDVCLSCYEIVSNHCRVICCNTSGFTVDVCHHGVTHRSRAIAAIRTLLCYYWGQAIKVTNVTGEHTLALIDLHFLFSFL